MMNQQSIETLKGIGEKIGKLFRKLNLTTVESLLHYYPRGYDAYEAPIGICEVKVGQVQTVCGKVVRTPVVNRFQRTQTVTIEVKDSTGMMHMMWFHMPFLKNTLRPNESYVFRGNVVKKRNGMLMEHPELFTLEQYRGIVESMQPIYGQTKGLGNKAISKAVMQALEQRQMEREYLPSYLRQKYQLAEYNFALEHIHFPKDKQELWYARKRLVFDEFFFFLVTVRRIKEKRHRMETSLILKSRVELKELEHHLPYQLTNAQAKVWEEIKHDLCSGFLMNRLVQGDVGSGKTILAVMSLILAGYEGYQGALMVPTEVLARQHYESIQELLETNNIPLQVILLTGSLTAKEKRLAYEKIQSQEAHIIVGTHALIQEKVVYHNLALVITDEQHRFGVGQREMLGGKGIEPHVLVMSATPIPRTLAIILYGDLDISIVDELPAQRLPIKNCVVNTSYREKAYQFMETEVKAGRQVYVICPMVEESEMLEAENVTDYSKVLKKRMPEQMVVACLHGKMKPKEKNKIMEQFANGDIHILVSTTVVEVGVNVPNATVMLIENAERFGLAQLHQLRGRVGRGKHQSYCIMVNNSKDGKTSERLEILNKSNDGFYIASEDLKLRGPGDFFGIRQSGDLEFQLADIFTDANLLKTVSEEVNALLEADPNLERLEHQELKYRLEQYSNVQYEKINL